MGYIDALVLFVLALSLADTHDSCLTFVLLNSSMFFVHTCEMFDNDNNVKKTYERIKAATMIF